MVRLDDLESDSSDEQINAVDVDDLTGLDEGPVMTDDIEGTIHMRV